jgi:hypothetical protein
MPSPAVGDRGTRGDSGLGAAESAADVAPGVLSAAGDEVDLPAPRTGVPSDADPNVDSPVGSIR